MGDSPADKLGFRRGGGGEGERDLQTTPCGSSSSTGGQQGHMLKDKVQLQEEEEGGANPPNSSGDMKEVPLTPEELLAKVKVLEATVEHQRKSLEKMAGLEEEVGTLKKRLKRAKQMFGNEWNQRHQDWEWLEAKRQVLEEEQAELEKMVGLLKKALAQKSREISLKLEQIQLLTMLKEVKLGKGKKSITFMNQVEDAGMEEAVGRRDADEILPEEVWKMILGNVSDPKDLWSLCNTCQIFDTILSKWKTGWLLEQALPYLYRHLPGEKLLGCRLVCKSWRGTIDNFLEDHTSLRPHDPDTWNSRRLDFVNPMMERKLGGGYQLSFSRRSDMSLFGDPGFLDKWKQNAIIGRGLALVLGRDFDDDEGDVEDEDRLRENAEGRYQGMWTKFQEFLAVFGKQVWHLSIYYCSARRSDSWEENLLHFVTNDVFRSFPNVRTLRIGSGDSDFRDAGIIPEALPPAPKLESLELSSFGSTIPMLMLRGYRIQLRRLNLSTIEWQDLNDMDWPNLTELHVSWFETLDCFRCLLGIGPRMPQLSKLGIKLAEGIFVDGVAPRSFDTSHTLLRIVRELCLTTRLSALRLEGGFCGFGIGEDKTFYDPAIAQLKTLEFGHYAKDAENSPPISPNYAFLLRCFPLLENVHVFIRKEELSSDFDEDEVAIAMALDDQPDFDEMRPLDLEAEPEILEVHKYMYDGDMYKSNIWELMPLLKVFTFQWDVYTRKGFEEYKERLGKKNKLM